MKYIFLSMRKYLCVALILGLLCACAKEGYPTGGPKDETPPVVLGTSPVNGSIDFSAKEFLINFDEYVQVKDADNNILVSPPMKQKPEYTTRGKGILVKLKDTLMANTTYLFQFKGGIVDFNEGNPLPSYEYVFSTGANIDSMTLRGRVLDAFSNKPSDDAVSVMAYAESQLLADSLAPDSVVAKQKPMYMTRCDKDGYFELNHLRSVRYRLLALADDDKNLMLGPSEAVAFLDTLVSPYHMPAPPDTTQRDSSLIAQLDSLASAPAASDTLAAPILPGQQLQMRLSLLKVETQRVVKAEFSRKGKLVIATQCPLSKQYSLQHLDSTDTSRLFVYPNPQGDTLTVWTASKDCDSLVLLLRDTNLTDTLKLTYRAKASSAMGTKKIAQTTMRSLVASSHPYYDTLRLAFENPISGFVGAAADSMVAVFNLTDSTTTYCGLRMTDSCGPQAYTHAMINFKGKGGEKYKFTVAHGQLRDIYGQITPDSLVVSTQYTKAENYGNIFITVTLDSALAPVIVQLTNEKGDTQQQHILTHSQKVAFEHLKGGKYNVRVVIDADADGHWTPGNYWQHRQPEEVRYFDKTLELRENWDMEEKWEVE